MPCLFCQEEFDEAAGRKRTREHIYGDWMRPHLEEVIGPVTHTRTKSTFEDLEADKRTYRGFPAQQAVPRGMRSLQQRLAERDPDYCQADPAPFAHEAERPRGRVVGVDAQHALVAWPTGRPCSSR